MAISRGQDPRSTSRATFPDLRHGNVRCHVADDTIIVEFDLLGTNLGEFSGMPPTGNAFGVPTIAVFFLDGDRIVNERVYFDTASLLTQIGRGDLLALIAGASGERPATVGAGTERGELGVTAGGPGRPTPAV